MHCTDSLTHPYHIAWHAFVPTGRLYTSVLNKLKEFSQEQSRSGLCLGSPHLLWLQLKR